MKYLSDKLQPFYTNTAFNASAGNWIGTGYYLPSERVKSISFKSITGNQFTSAFIGSVIDDILGNNGVNFSYPAGYDQGKFSVLYQQPDQLDYLHQLDNVTPQYENIVFGIGCFSPYNLTFFGIRDITIVFE